VQARLDGPDRDAQLRRRLRVAEPAQVEEHHGRALAARQTGDGGLDARAQVAQLGPFVRAHVLVGEVAQGVVASPGQGIRRGHVGPSPSQAMAAEVQPDARQPRAEAVGAREPIEAQVGLERRVLGDLLRRVVIAQHAAAQGDQERPVPRQQEGKGTLVAVLRRVYESDVVGIVLHHPPPYIGVVYSLI
jgi:hypothetical protein